MQSEKDTSGEWNLILVDRNHYIPNNYQVELTELSNGKKVDSRIYPELQQMFNDARAEGLALFVREGYRTTEEQQKIMDEKNLMKNKDILQRSLKSCHMLQFPMIRTPFWFGLMRTDKCSSEKVSI